MANKRTTTDDAAVIAEAEAIQAAAAQEAADNNQGMVASVTRDVPRVRVEVFPGNTCSVEVSPGVTQGFTEGEEFEMDGPTAIAAMSAGHIVIKGTA